MTTNHAQIAAETLESYSDTASATAAQAHATLAVAEQLRSIDQTLTLIHSILAEGHR